MSKITLHPWQKEMLNNVYGGIKFGPMSIISAGRQTGKSTFSQYSKLFDQVMYGATYMKLDSALVDGAEWVTVECNQTIAKWVREQKSNLWYEHTGQSGFRSKFDLSDRLYTILQLKFQ